jgi:hypothetical protein
VIKLPCGLSLASGLTKHFLRCGNTAAQCSSREAWAPMRHSHRERWRRRAPLCMLFPERSPLQVVYSATSTSCHALCQRNTQTISGRSIDDVQCSSVSFIATSRKALTHHYFNSGEQWCMAALIRELIRLPAQPAKNVIGKPTDNCSTLLHGSTAALNRRLRS